MSINFDDAKKVLDSYSEEANDYINSHKLSMLPAYSKLQKKETVGNLYREDQLYFEAVSGFKSKFFGIKGFFLKMKAENSDRILSRNVEATLAYIDEKIKMFDGLVGEAKQRLKFFESIIYLVSNMAYGDY